MESNILVLSSLFFITNTATAFIKEYYVYSFLFGLLTTTSLVVHSNDNIYTNVIDKMAVSSIVICGAYTLYNKIHIDNWLNCSIVIIAFVLCIYLYIYGFINKKYCFCDDKGVAKKYHCVLHVKSSVGHHIIIFL